MTNPATPPDAPGAGDAPVPAAAPPARPALWMRPWMLALIAGAAVLLAAAVPALWQAVQMRSAGAGAGDPDGPGQAAGAADPMAPWGQSTGADGRSRVFGIVLGVTPIDTLRQRQAGGTAEMEMALVAPVGGTAALEGHIERFTAGGVTGRLVVSTAADPALHAGWRERSAAQQPTGQATRYTLAAADAAVAGQAVIDGLTFVPSARLAAETVALRFGEPAERLGTGDGLSHWLYPTRGLAVSFDADGRAVLQYVDPAAFGLRLRAPLQAAGASAPAR